MCADVFNGFQCVHTNWRNRDSSDAGQCDHLNADLTLYFANVRSSHLGMSSGEEDGV